MLCVISVYPCEGPYQQRACDLAWNYDVVLTTFQRLSIEWTYQHKHTTEGREGREGRGDGNERTATPPTKAGKRKGSQGKRKRRGEGSGEAKGRGEERGEGLSPLMHVHWLRVVLDEGHALGCSLGITNKLEMACSLRAGKSNPSLPFPSLPSLPIYNHIHTYTHIFTHIHT